MPISSQELFARLQRGGRLFPRRRTFRLELLLLTCAMLGFLRGIRQYSTGAKTLSFVLPVIHLHNIDTFW